MNNTLTCNYKESFWSTKKSVIGKLSRQSLIRQTKVRSTSGRKVAGLTSRSNGKESKSCSGTKNEARFVGKVAYGKKSIEH